MALKYYKSATDDGGIIDDEITSGTENALFNDLTIAEEIAGSEKYRKIWIESDVPITLYVGISSPGLFEAYLFPTSTGEDEVVGDFAPASEDHFGGIEVTTGTTDSFTFVTTTVTMFRAGEYLIHNNLAYLIDTVVDSAGETTVTITTTFGTTPVEGDWITSAYVLSLTAAAAKPLWRQNTSPAGYVATVDNNSVQILMVG